ncbi:Pancreatic triacylglycerol lipase [Halotydeus destructor]|nr:Pancreatic triacylglycerol lipase [Halotydeus destructor]
MVDTRFTLFSRDSAEGVNLDLSRTGHDWSDRPLKILIPGWLDNLVIAKWMVDLKDALLFNENSRVIAVEWNNFTPYIIAASNSRVVGFEVANLLNYLSANSVRLENVHLIGHSLGAHISGYAGAMVRGVGRITALDPARPYFEHMPPSVRLDVSDALQVDAIHSDTGKVFPIGFLGHLGHVDFYPNQDAQPACLKDSFMRGMMESFNFKLITGLMEGVRYSLTCAHQKSLEYYQESLINDKCRFIGVRCPSYEKVLRGECTCDDSDFTCMEISRTSMDSTSLARLEHEPGKWFVHTNPEAPYCMFQYQVVMQLGLNKDIEHLPASLHIQLLRSGSQHPVRAKLTSSDRTLRSEQRMSYFVVSRSELWSNIPPTMSVYWTVDDRSKVKSNSSHELVSLINVFNDFNMLIYLKLSILSCMLVLVVTRDNDYHGLKPIELICHDKVHLKFENSLASNTSFLVKGHGFLGCEIEATAKAASKLLLRVMVFEYKCDHLQFNDRIKCSGIKDYKDKGQLVDLDKSGPSVLSIPKNTGNFEVLIALGIDGSGKSCPEKAFKCKDKGNVCIAKEYKCNGYKECTDGSDEHGCGKPSSWEVVFFVVIIIGILGTLGYFGYNFLNKH